MRVPASQHPLEQMAKILQNNIKYDGLWHWGADENRYCQTKGEPINVQVLNKPSIHKGSRTFTFAAQFGFNKKADTTVQVKLSASNSKVIQARSAAIVNGDSPTATLVAHCKIHGACSWQNESFIRPGVREWAVVYLPYCSRSVGMKVTFDFLMRLHDEGFIIWGR